MKPRKYIHGAHFASAIEAARWILQGKWTMFHHKPVHPSWASGWTLTTLRSVTGPRGCLRQARINPKWKQKQKDQHSERNPTDPHHADANR